VADVEVAVARIDDELPSGQVGQIAADVGPGHACVGRAEDFAAAEHVTYQVDDVAVPRIDLDIRDLELGAKQRTAAVHPVYAMVLGHVDPVLSPRVHHDVNRIGIISVGSLVGNSGEAGIVEITLVSGRRQGNHVRERGTQVK